MEGLSKGGNIASPAGNLGIGNTAPSCSFKFLFKNSVKIRNQNLDC